MSDQECHKIVKIILILKIILFIVLETVCWERKTLHVEDKNKVTQSGIIKTSLAHVFDLWGG